MAGYEGLIHHLDFEKGDVGKLTRIPWFLWNFMAWEFYDWVDEKMKCRMRESVILMWARIKGSHPELEEGGDVFIKILKKEVEKAKMFHYLVIMAVSGSLKDDKCRECYEKLMYMKTDVLSFLEDMGQVEDFTMFFDGLTEILRPYSLYTSGAYCIINLALSCYIDYDGGIPLGTDLLAMEQISYKKERITANIVAMVTDDINKFKGVGSDTHVKRIIACLVKSWFLSEINTPITTATSTKYALIIVEMLDPKIGIYTNEILGQLSQYNNDGDVDGTRILDSVFKWICDKNNLYKEVVEQW